MKQIPVLMVCLLSLGATSLATAQTSVAVAPTGPAKTVVPSSGRAPLNTRSVATPVVNGSTALAPRPTATVPITPKPGAGVSTVVITPRPTTTTTSPTTVSGQTSATPSPFAPVINGNDAAQAQEAMIQARDTINQAFINNRDQLNANVLRQRDVLNAALQHRDSAVANSSLGLATTNSFLRQDINGGTGVFVPTTTNPGTNTFVPTVQTSATVGGPVPGAHSSGTVIATNVVTSTNQLPGFGLR